MLIYLTRICLYHRMMLMKQETNHVAPANNTVEYFSPVDQLELIRSWPGFIDSFVGCLLPGASSYLSDGKKRSLAPRQGTDSEHRSFFHCCSGCRHDIVTSLCWLFPSLFVPTRKSAGHSLANTREDGSPWKAQENKIMRSFLQRTTDSGFPQVVSNPRNKR